MKMTAAERQALIDAFEHSRDLLLHCLAGIDERTWHHKEAGQWCIGEVVEHLIILEKAVLEMAVPRFLSQPTVRETHPEKDAALAATVRDRSRRIDAPERVCPKGNSAAPDEEIARFSALRSKTIEFLRETNDDLRHHAGPHPILGTLDCYQWLVVLSAHTERHVLQIEEMKNLRLVIN